MEKMKRGKFLCEGDIFWLSIHGVHPLISGDSYREPETIIIFFAECFLVERMFGEWQE